VRDTAGTLLTESLASAFILVIKVLLRTQGAKSAINGAEIEKNAFKSYCDDGSIFGSVRGQISGLVCQIRSIDQYTIKWVQ